MLSGEPGRYRWIHERIRALSIDHLYHGRFSQARLANGARSLQGKIFRSREDGDVTFSALDITLLSPDSALVLGSWKLQRAKDRPHGRFTLIFKRLPEGWRIVHDHTSAAAPPKQTVTSVANVTKIQPL
jgi:hypothetical protein